MGFTVAIDDFGAGHAGHSLLADCQPDIVKPDMRPGRNVQDDRARQVIVRAVPAACEQRGIAVVAEGVECRAEFEALRDLGISLFRDHLFARPATGARPPPAYPRSTRRSPRAKRRAFST